MHSTASDGELEPARLMALVASAGVKVVALTDGNTNLAQLNKTARGHLERYYKYRHDNKLDGLPELVQKMKTELP